MAALASAAELNLHLQRTIAPDVAALALAGASGAVRAYCGWNLLQESTTFTVEGDGSVILSLPTLHLVDVTEIRLDGDVMDLSAVIVHPRGQLIWSSAWPNLSKITVDVVHGWPDPPDLVRLVTLTIAARIVNNPDNVKTATVGTVTRTYDPSLTSLDMRLLDQFRLP